MFANLIRQNTAILRQSPKRAALALIYGVVCHLGFAAGVGSMMFVMATGMQAGLGPLQGVWAIMVNAILIVQFPLAHSMLLTRRGRQVLAKLAPASHGTTLAPTTYAIIASLQLLALFWLWSPSDVIWWQTPEPFYWAHLLLYQACFGLLLKATFDAGIGLQSGMIGWTALWKGQKPNYPDMPTSGLFRFTRQPIYLAFSLTLWTTPVITPDQLSLALLFTAYCVLAPRLKERRFLAIFGERFTRYQKEVPYWLPRWPRHP